MARHSDEGLPPGPGGLPPPPPNRPCRAVTDLLSSIPSEGEFRSYYEEVRSDRRGFFESSVASHRRLPADFAFSFISDLATSLLSLDKKNSIQLAASSSYPVAVRPGKHGKCLVATAAVPAGAPLLLERLPLAAARGASTAVSAISSPIRRRSSFR